MTNTSAHDVDTETADDAPAARRKWSKIHLALLACMPFVLLGSGYAGWTRCLAPAPLQKTCNYLWAEIEAIEAMLAHGS